MALHPPLSPRQCRLSLKPYARQTFKLLLGCVSIVSLATSVALADYVPPSDSHPYGPTPPLGTRTGSCGKASRGKLAALAPLSHVGQTTATHPTFVWYVPDAESYPISLWLYGYDGNGKPIPLRQIGSLQSKQGIMHYQLPLDQAGLSSGQNYLWEVTLVCKSSGDHNVQLLRTNIAVVAMPATLQASLAKMSDHLQRASLYAKAGFWYDALAETLVTSQKQPFTITLLEDLVKLEASSTSKEAKEQRDRLKEVIRVERQ